MKAKLSYQIASLFFVVIGIAVRAIVFFQNRSLIIDEANVARNLFERGGFDLFENLSYQQYAPPIWMWLSDAVTLIMEHTEMPIRLIPLLGSFVCLFLLYKILDKINLHQWAKVLVMGLFALAPFLIRYATEAKQYSTDMMMVLLVIYGCLHFSLQKLSRVKVLGISFLLAGSLWFSMPMVFVLVGVFAYYLLQMIQQKNYRLLPFVLVGSLLCIASFALYYFSILHTDASNNYLLGFHANYFMPLIPLSLDGVNQFTYIWFQIIRAIVGVTALPIAAFGLFLLLGVYQLFKQNKALFAFCIAILLACITASALQKFSMIPRVVLFLFPILILIAGFGFSLICQLKYVKWAGLLLGLFLIVNQKGYTYFAKPLLIEQVKPMLSFLNEHIGEKDLIYIHHAGVPSYVYYTEVIDKSKRFEFSNLRHLSKWGENVGQFVKERDNKFWVVFTHAIKSERDEALKTAYKIGELSQSFETEKASCYLFEKR